MTGKRVILRETQKKRENSMNLKVSKTMLVAAMAFATMGLSSCYTTTNFYGNMKQESPAVKVNSTRSDLFIYGLVPTKNCNITDADYVKGGKDYKVKKYHTFVDGLIACITLGIYTPVTTEYYLPYDKMGK